MNGEIASNLADDRARRGDRAEQRLTVARHDGPRESQRRR